MRGLRQSNARYVAPCKGCPFRTTTCGSKGPLDARLVLVGESPGENETKTGIPFVGESGQLLDHVIAEAAKQLGVPVPDALFTNAIACAPRGKKDQAAVAAAARCCHGRLVEEVASHPRTAILALGNGALWSLTNDYTSKITQERGRIYRSDLAEKGIVASVHPAFLLRGGGSYSKFRDDVRNALSLLYDKEIPRYEHSEYIVLPSEYAIERTCERLLQSKPRPGYDHVVIAADLETSGFSARDDYVLACGLGWENDRSYVIPGKLIRTPAARRILTLTKARFRYVWHNGKFDVGFLRPRNVPARVDEDTMLLSYALDETRGIHDLEQVSNDAVGAPNWKSELEKWLPKKGASYKFIPPHILYDYLGKDISATLQSFYVLRERVRNDEDLERLYTKTLLPASTYLEQVERAGFPINQETLEENQKIVEAEIARLEGHLQAIAERWKVAGFNSASPAQVAVLLYDRIKLPKIRGSRSTDKDTLAMLPKNPVVDLILQIRKVRKLESTYTRGLKKNIEKDGHIHCSFKIHGTVTGRLATGWPNMQNIPRPAGSFVNIRRQFTVKAGRRLLEPDLNQAELRCLAELSRDPNLCAIYLDPDHPGLHHEMSVFLFGEKYTSEDKMRTKAVNFGIVYGRTAPSLSDEFGLPTTETQRWIDGWFERFPLAHKFIMRCRSAPLRGVSLITPFGNKRRFGVVGKDNLESIQNEASNFPHQSIASHIMLNGSRRAFYFLRRRGYDLRVRNLVHDSCVFDIPDDYSIACQIYRVTNWFLEHEPLRWGLNYIPFRSDAKTGLNWGELKDWRPGKDFPT